MKRLLLLGSFVLGNFSILVIAFALITMWATQSSSADQTQANDVVLTLGAQELRHYGAAPVELPQIVPTIIESDARPTIINKFLVAHSSPMVGMGRVIVAEADKHKIPFNLLPAIAMCEGNAGKVMPADSYNTYGWGIYGGKVTRFSSWEEGIATVSKGLRTNYYDRGLETVEAIMAKYAPPSEGSWANCVERYMTELE